ncbi:MAG: helicase-related protein [Micrococcaceae bacterium]
MFDETSTDWTRERSLLREVLDEAEWRAAERTTINAHYTDPAYATQIWAALGRLGFTTGDVLEPGSGAGTFIGLAPDGARMVGVELDPLTAAISRGLYPHADIRTESFADTRIPEGLFDATVGNVPFADVTLHDPAHNPSGHSMHNHFIVKALHLTRPGGVVAVLTSHWTMDAQNPAARREMNELADLLGAVRLPSGAHRRAAGTEALTDLLLFRRRNPGTEPASDIWEMVTPVTIDGERVKVNTYFADYRPDHVLGDLHVGQGMYGNQTLRVTADLTTVSQRLNAALTYITASAAERRLVFTERTAAQEQARAARKPADPGLFDGSILANTDGQFRVVASGELIPLQVPKSAATELRALLTLRDGAIGLLEQEAATREDTTEIDTARARLRGQYEQYVTRYGPLNRYTLRRTGRTDPGTGEDTYARTTPTPLRILRGDPFGPLVVALEVFDEQEQTATGAGILSHRVVAPTPPVRGVESPTDAISVSLDRTGGIELPLIAELLGTDDTDARAALAGHVFEDPTTGDLIHAPEYLSGNVRVKLDAAETAAKERPELAVNVTALKEVMPEPLGADDIAARLGAVWISADVHQQFLREILKAADVRVENPLPGMWEVRGGRQGVLATSEWGTERRPAPDLAQSVMEQKRIQVYDEHRDPDGTTIRIFNPVETTAAQEKADQLQERFSEWVWEEPERARVLTDEYNRRFNSIVLRDYTTAGEYLTFPGMAKSFTPRPHQRAAVGRMIAEPATGLFHEVGAGKTAEMVAGVMEMRRMGLIQKPMVVVPNHMLEQFSREWLQIYPRARVLAASSGDLTADRRRLFVARAAASDWDGIILTQGAFARIRVDPETEHRYIERQVVELKAAYEAAKGEDRMSVKRIQKRLLQAENKLKGLVDKARDPGITFEATGVDYVVVDEMHMYKNLATESNIRDASIDGSERASDLHLKLESLRHRGHDRVVTGATATPIANSVTEAYVMQRYLRPDLLEEAGLGHFDAWAATFGETVTEMEMSPTGSSFRLKTRFARFQNVPEMLRLWSVFADVKTAEDLKLPVPEIAERGDGKRAADTVVIEPTRELQAYIDDIATRAERVQSKAVRPDEDNMLKISTDGRKAALDVRLVLPATPSGPSKVDVAADMIHRVWNQHADRSFTDPTTDEPSPVRGGLQLVFCDLGTPNKDRWNVYDELRAQLQQRGMPDGAVRFMHEAKTDTDKARLFAAARTGHIAVLVGSTEKMGVGTNVQARAVALHHLDCPWRPSDIAQREGRVIRQGNQNDEVVITRIVTEGSFDSYMWQGIERKARFIGQIMRGSLDVREIEEIDSAALSAAEAKAIASGNPLMLEKSIAQNDYTKLQRLERAHSRNQSMLHHTKSRAAEIIDHAQRDIAALTAALPRIRDTSGDRFQITISGHHYDSRVDAAEAVAYWARDQNIQYLSDYAERDLGRLGSVSGLQIHARASASFGTVQVHFSLENLPRTSFGLPRDQILSPTVGLIQRLENRASQLPTIIETLTNEIRQEQETLDEAEQRIGVPFKHAEALRAAHARLDEIDAKLAELSEPAPGATMPGGSAPDPAVIHAPAGRADASTPSVRAPFDKQDVRDYRPSLGSRADPAPHPAPDPQVSVTALLRDMVHSADTSRDGPFL